MSAILVQVEQLEDGLFFAASDSTPGCWGDGASEQEALDDFCFVLPDWWWLKARDGDDDLPPSDWTFSA